eukprot:Unigene6995_Nuclearia_a/m.21424 Unigene6995_Nuclearia_a/g.21424  ORF Unigene6995_Nuclearia_a/g.21424 Unigene6995_Nuclearia_a/m.21424 type:complete len:612 (+) Unigene6995_Nuclearia_a:34-1869(+)
MPPQVCPACNELCATDKNPVGRLPCMHPICQRCVDKPVNYKRVCLVEIEERLLCNTPYDRAEMLPPPAKLLALGKCTECKKRDAVNACKTCNKGFCDRDVELHTDLNANHDVVAIAGQSHVIKCGMHTNIHAINFCTNCSQFVCSICFDKASQHHSNHSFITVVEALARQHHMVMGLCDALVAKAKVCEQAQQAVRADIDRLIKHKDSSLLITDEFFRPLVEPLQSKLDELHARHRFLKDTVTQAIEADIKTLHDHADQLLVTRAHLELVRAAATSAAPRKDGNAHAELSRTQLVARLEALRKVEIVTEPAVLETTRIVFKPQPTMVELLKMPASMLGKVETARTHGLTAQDYLNINTKVREFTSTSPGYIVAPRYVVFDKQHQLFITDSNSQRIQVMTIEGHHSRSITMGAQPCGIALTPTGDLWVSHSGNNQVVLINASGSVKRSIATAATPYGVCSPSDGSVLIACSSGSGMFRFTAEGAQCWRSMGDGSLSGPCAVVAVEEDDVRVAICCDTNNNRLQVLQLDNGVFVRHIGAGQMSQPRGLAWDASARRLVVGESDKVSVWTIDGAGERVHMWGSGVVSTVNGVALSPLGRTVAVCSTGNASVVLF